MDKKEAIEVLKSNRPNGHHETLSSAVDVAIAAIEESMVQKPAINSDYAKCKIEAEIKRLEENPEGDGGN